MSHAALINDGLFWFPVSDTAAGDVRLRGDPAAPGARRLPRTARAHTGRAPATPRVGALPAGTAASPATPVIRLGNPLTQRPDKL